MTKNRVVITGVAPLTAIGFGKKALWKSITSGKTGLGLHDYFIDGKKYNSYYVHKIKNLDIERLGIDKSLLNDIRIWKESESWIDLGYFLATIKLAIKDSKLSYDRESNKIGLVLAHENPGLDQFYKEMICETYDLAQKGLSKKD